MRANQIIGVDELHLAHGLGRFVKMVRGSVERTRLCLHKCNSRIGFRLQSVRFLLFVRLVEIDLRTVAAATTLAGMETKA